MPGLRGVEQAHHQQRPIRGHREPPLAHSVAQAAGEPAGPALQLPSAERHRGPGGEAQAHRPPRRRPARVVAARDGHLGRRVGGVRQAQQAHLLGVAPGVEELDVGAVAPRGVLRRDHRGRELGHEPVGGAVVRAGPEGLPCAEHQPPPACPVAQAVEAGESLLQGGGGERDDPARGHGQRLRAEAPAGVVVARDLHPHLMRYVAGHPHQRAVEAARGGGDVRELHPALPCRGDVAAPHRPEHGRARYEEEDPHHVTLSRCRSWYPLPNVSRSALPAHLRTGRDPPRGAFGKKSRCPAISNEAIALWPSGPSIQSMNARPARAFTCGCFFGLTRMRPY